MDCNNLDLLTEFIFDSILKIFHEVDPNFINPDCLDHPEQLTKFFYAISISGPHAFFNFLATKKVTVNEFHELMGEVMAELKSP